MFQKQVSVCMYAVVQKTSPFTLLFLKYSWGLVLLDVPHPLNSFLLVQLHQFCWVHLRPLLPRIWQLSRQMLVAIKHVMQLHPVQTFVMLPPRCDHPLSIMLATWWDQLMITRHQTSGEYRKKHCLLLTIKQTCSLF